MRSFRSSLSILSATALMAGALSIAGVGPFDALAQTDPSDNLFPPDVQSFASIDGWTAPEGVLLHHSSVSGFEDDNALQVTVVDDEVAAGLIEGPVADVQEGYEYGAAWRIRPVTNATSVRCVLVFLDGDGQPLDSPEGESVQQEPGEWTEAVCSGTAPDEAATAAVAVAIADAQAGDVHHVDDLRLVATSAPDEQEPPAEDEPPGEEPAGEAGPNLLTGDTHSFESSTQGWAAQGNTTLARKVGTAADGDSSLMIIVDRSGPWPDSSRTARAGTHYLRDYGVPADAGTAYQASWSIQAHETDAPARCELRWYNEQNREIETVAGETVTATSDGWTTAECAGVAPADTSHVSLRVFIGEVDYDSVFYVDDARLSAATGGAPSPGPDPKPSPTTDPELTGDPEPTEDPGPTEDPEPTEDSEPTEEPTEDPEPTEEPTEDPDPEPTEDPPAGGTPGHGRQVNASNTGPSANGLSHSDLRSSGTVTTSRHGQVIEGLDVRGSIIVKHDNVVIRNSRVRQSSHYAIHGSGRNALIEYVEVDGRDNPDRLGILMSSGWKVRFTEVRGHSSGVRLSSGTTLEYSYVHSQALKPGSHNTAAAFHGGSGVKVLNNHLVGSTSSSLSLYPDSPITDVLVEGNLFNGGSYCLYAGYGPKPGASGSHTLRYVGNVFAQSPFARCGHYGPYTNWDAGKQGNVWSGNTWEDGSPL